LLAALLTCFAKLVVSRKHYKIIHTVHSFIHILKNRVKMFMLDN